MSVVHALVVAALFFSDSFGRASSHYQTYEAIAQRLDDGNKVTSEKIYIKLDSDESQLKPVAAVDKTKTNSLVDESANRNKLYAAWAPEKMKKYSRRRYHKHNLVGGADYESKSMNSIGGHQFFARLQPRTVESPALSVDTGRGRSVSPGDRLANGIKRLFNVEEGHYTDLYERIDKHKSLKKGKLSGHVSGSSHRT